MQLSTAIKKQQEACACQHAYQGIRERLLSHSRDFGERSCACFQTNGVGPGVRSTVDPLLITAGHVGHLRGDKEENGHGKTNNRNGQKNIADSEVHLRVTKGDEIRAWRTRGGYHYFAEEMAAS